METSKLHKVIIRTETYDVVSTDTGFYAFVGKRLYCAFDKFICDSDREVFYEHVKKQDSEYFALNMIDEAGTVGLWCAKVNPTDKEDLLEVLIANVSELFTSNQKFAQELIVKNRILDLYGDYVFAYNVSRDRVVIYESTLSTQDKMTMKFEDIIKRIKANAADSEQEAIDKFVASAKKGEREFELYLEGAAFEKNPQVKCTHIKATSIYEDGELVSIVGYIKQSGSESVSPKRKVERDSFTGLLSKGEIVNAAAKAIDVEKREGVTLAIIDIDYFKKVNDIYGHMVGDELLKSIATIIEKEVGDTGLVGRFGGDEFFVVFFDVYDMEYCRERLRSIKNIVTTTYPVNNENKPAVTISIGCAAYPKDASNYEDIFTLADFALYRAKEKGRNRYIIYDKEKHGDIEEIKNVKKTGERINGRGIMSIGDVLCIMMDRIYNFADYSVQKLLDDLVENFSYERIILYTGNPYKATWVVGEKIPSRDVFDETERYLMEDAFAKEYKDNILIVNNIDILESKSQKVCELLRKQEVLSFVQIKFKDKNRLDCILSLEAVNKKIAWDAQNLHVYRIMAKLLSEYDLSTSENEFTK